MSEKAPHQHLTHDQMMNTNPNEPFVRSSMTREQELPVARACPLPQGVPRTGSLYGH